MRSPSGRPTARPSITGNRPTREAGRIRRPPRPLVWNISPPAPTGPARSRERSGRPGPFIGAHRVARVPKHHPWSARSTPSRSRLPGELVRAIYSPEQQPNTLQTTPNPSILGRLLDGGYRPLPLPPAVPSARQLPSSRSRRVFCSSSRRRRWSAPGDLPQYGRRGLAWGHEPGETRVPASFSR
jgi:hypothetical protein